jgi:hypothetical protein
MADELEIADYEILLRVYRNWLTNIEVPPPGETPEQYQRRINRIMELKELQKQFKVVLRKLRMVIVGE